MLTIQIICIGKLKEAYLKSAINEYSKRLSKYCKLDILELPDEKIAEKVNIKSIDALDLKGKQFSSEEFSSEIEKISMTSSHITFIIGGSLGLTNALLNICHQKICFSKMTFPHQLIRVFLLEQLFRAFKINNNEKYHH